MAKQNGSKGAKTEFVAILSLEQAKDKAEAAAETARQAYSDALIKWLMAHGEKKTKKNDDGTVDTFYVREAFNYDGALVQPVMRKTQSGYSAFLKRIGGGSDLED